MYFSPLSQKTFVHALPASFHVQARDTDPFSSFPPIFILMKPCSASGCRTVEIWSPWASQDKNNSCARRWKSRFFLMRSVSAPSAAGRRNLPLSYSAPARRRKFQGRQGDISVRRRADLSSAAEDLRSGERCRGLRVHDARSRHGVEDLFSAVDMTDEF